MKTRNKKPYCISFDTKEMPGKVVAVQVSLNTIIVRDNDTVRVDLVDHPLYHHLVSYVLNNLKK